MENNGSSQIIERGDICIETNTGMKIVCQDVNHIDDLQLNLISPESLDNEWYLFVFGKGALKLIIVSLVMASGKDCVLFI